MANSEWRIANENSNNISTRLNNHQELTAISHQPSAKFCIEATLEDYAIAYELAKDIFAHTLSDLKKPARELLEQIEKMTKEKATELKIKPSDVTFTRKTVRDYTGLPDQQVRRRIEELCDLEVLEIVSGKQGRICEYRLAGGIKKDETFKGLLTPDSLKQRLAQFSKYQKTEKSS